MTKIRTSKFYTIDRHISEEEKLHPKATGEFTKLLHDLTFSMRIIASEVRRAGINDILGLTENTNIHGEKVRKIDEYANEVIIRSMDHGGNLCVMVSEEEDEVIEIPSSFKKGKYVLAFDPLDGSSNLDVNITIGTIFSLYQRLDPESDTAGTMSDILQPGYKQVAAGYVLYGSSTLLAYTTGNGVNVFTYEPSIGEFLLVIEKLKMPDFGSYYSCNEGNYNKWDSRVQQYVDYIKSPSDNGVRPYTMRYVATAVADIHRMLHYGGIYMYPGEKTKPQGKIRLLYEANPLAWMIEQAGGRAITGKSNILEVQPETIHQTVPIFMGSRKNIDELELFLEGKHQRQINS